MLLNQTAGYSRAFISRAFAGQIVGVLEGAAVVNHGDSPNGQAVAILSSWAQGTRRTRKAEPGMDKVNLSEKLAQFSEQWKPKIVGELNG